MKTKTITLSNGKEVYKPKSLKPLYIFLLIILLIFAMYITNFNIFAIFENFDQFLDMLIKMFPPIFNKEALIDYFSYTAVIFPELITTLQIAILGTIFGALLGFPVAIVASANISNKYISSISKFLLSIIRTIPVLISAILFSFIFGLNEFSGMVAVTLFTFSIISKMLYEIIERVDMGAYEAAISSGIKPYNAFLLTIRPQIMPAFYSICLYSFEINVKSATVLGYVNAGGIGLLLKNSMAVRKYDQVGLIILYTIILVITIDLITQYIRKEMI